jgi:UDP-glucose 4-epimerase
LRALLTGASSFTGYWIARELAQRGHEVHATFTRAGESDYEGIRQRRVLEVARSCSPVFGCRFGDERFLDAVRSVRPDVLCHHGAVVSEYRRSDFDVMGAFTANTRNLPLVLDALAGAGTRRLVLTGSVFENDEGAGSGDRPAFSPYGLSKGFTFQAFRYWCAKRGMSLAKFVISNPFGPLEEPRFTAYLITSWLKDETPVVRTPAYVRDNIHVELLAAAYARFAEAERGTQPGMERLGPSGFVGTQGEFASLVAGRLRPLLGKACRFELAEQTDFSEPLVRVNTQPASGLVDTWDEDAAWEALARYYHGQ